MTESLPQTVYSCGVMIPPLGTTGISHKFLQLSAIPTIDPLFRKARKRTLIEDLHWHDTRHTAITRLAKIFNVLELARIVGHKDLKNLQIYFNETAEELAKKLD